MFFIAAAYYYMNKADPDCGTSFSWVTKAIGPQLGWIAGWAICRHRHHRDGQPGPDRRPYTFLLFGWDAAAASTAAVTAVGVLWIAADDRDLRDRDRALGRTAGRAARGRDHHPGRSSRSSLWSRSTRRCPRGCGRPEPLLVQPLRAQPQRALGRGLLLAVFIYWGWDTTATVNEETEDPGEAPGRATVISTLILLGIYLIVADRRAGLRRGRPADRKPGRRTQRTGDGGLRLAAGQDL